jgi:hypothetical protein
MSRLTGSSARAWWYTKLVRGGVVPLEHPQQDRSGRVQPIELPRRMLGAQARRLADPEVPTHPGRVPGLDH